MSRHKVIIEKMETMNDDNKENDSSFLNLLRCFKFKIKN